MKTIKTKISRKQGTNKSIAFPPGKPPKGTCEFATEKCLRECAKEFPVFHSAIETYNLFCELSCTDLVNKLLKEMQTTSNLSWFTESGDCPKHLTSKIAKIMSNLSIEQNGFTRNKLLWEKTNSMPNVRMVLTEENETKAKIYKGVGLVGVPNYEEQRVKILINDTIWICGGGRVTCGCSRVEDDESERDEDCGLCYKLRRGCYAD